MAHRITKDFLERNRDGSEAALLRDFRALPKGDQKWLYTELERLSDEAILSRCREISGWPGSAEGRWVMLEIAPYLLLCQLQLTNQELFRFGAGSGVLKVVRVVHKNYASDLLQEFARGHEDDDD